MFQSATYFVKFSMKHCPKYLYSSIINKLLYSIHVVFNIYMPKMLLDYLFSKEEKMNSIYAVGILIGGNFLLRVAMSALTMWERNQKEVLQKEFELYMFENLVTCDYENIESPEFYDLREKAKNYIGGQWGQFGRQLDIFFELVGNLVTLISVLYIFLKYKIIVILLYIALFAIDNMVSSYYKKKSIQYQMNEMPTVLRRKRYYEELTKDVSFSKEIRMNHLHEWILEHYDKYMCDFSETTKKIYRCNLIVKMHTGISAGIKLLITNISLVYLVRKGMSVGTFTMLLGAFVALNDVINNVIMGAMDLSRYKAYYKEFLSYVNIANKQRNGTKKLEEAENFKIELINVSFRYPGKEEYILKDFSATIDSHTKVALVGANGAGKSTIIKLILRLYNTYEGVITLNGIDIKEYEQEEYNRLFSTVFQDYVLYAMSLKENICLKRSAETADEDVIDILKKMHLYNKRGYEKQLDTQIYKYFDENGIEPSGGDGQKVGIARAIMNNTPIAILDEPTAALDPKIEYEIYNDFANVINSDTVIYISHRLASAKLCDKILVLEDGRVAEEGSFHELMEKKGIFARMYQLQAEMYL